MTDREKEAWRKLLGISEDDTTDEEESVMREEIEDWDWKKELDECKQNGWNPYYYAKNWKHWESRIRASYMKKMKIQLEISKKWIQQWLIYYQENDEDQYYNSWIEDFWNGKEPDDVEKEYCYMCRVYDKAVQAGLIELYEYPYSKEEFLNRWNWIKEESYNPDSDLCVYAGRKNIPGKFYESLQDFFMPANPVESDWWKLIEQVLEDLNH